MIKNSEGETVIDLGDQVRGLLIKARILRQEAVVQAELDSYYEEIGGNWEASRKLRIGAQQCRLVARLLMREIEVMTGRAYVRGEEIDNLAYLITGRDFRNWPCYQREYDNHKLFLGTDPE